jgi:hypothetical protein
VKIQESNYGPLAFASSGFFWTSNVQQNPKMRQLAGQLFLWLGQMALIPFTDHDDRADDPWLDLARRGAGAVRSERPVAISFIFLRS